MNEYENQEWLAEWLRCRTKYDQEHLDNLDKYKTTVKNLNFSQQNLKGKLVIENFPKLTSLNLGNNSLEKVEIINCPELKKVITSHNKLNSLKIKDCKNIKELYTHNNKLKELDVSDITNLKILSYSDNPLKDSKKAELDSKGLPKEGDTNADAIRTLGDDFFIDNPEVQEIDISNEAGWEGKLEVKNCPKLTSLVVDNCKLEELVIENCPNLKTLSFRHNKVREIDLTNFPDLEGLYCSNNQLTKLDLEEEEDDEMYDIKRPLHLKHLVCDNNPIQQLKVKHLKDLESLYCFKCKIKELDCQDMNKLEEIYVANQILTDLKLNIKNCQQLIILDCAENLLHFFLAKDLKKLETVSVRISSILGDAKIENCPNLQYLDYGYTNFLISELKVSNCGLKKCFSSSKSPLDWKKFPGLELFEIDNKEVPEFEHFLTEKKEKSIKEILDNPDNYSLDKLLELISDKKNFEGVGQKLKKQLATLIEEKVKKKFFDEGYFSEKETPKDNDEEKNSDSSIPLPTETPSEILPSQEDKDEGYHSGDEEQKNAKYRAVAIKLGQDSKAGKKGKKLAQIISINIKEVSNKTNQIKGIIKELESYTQAQDKTSIEYQIFANPEYREAIQTKLAEFKALVARLEKEEAINSNTKDKLPSKVGYYWAWAFVVVGWMVLVGLVIGFLRKGKRKKS